MVVGIIPARLHSTRLPRKMLVDICGKPLIQHTWEQASKAKLDILVVATDSEEIADVVKSFGGKVVMTGEHNTGSDRVAEAARQFPCDVVVNIQGDEPMVPPEAINQLTEMMLSSNEVMGTVCVPFNDQRLESPEVIKVVLDKQNYALYFSRSVAPFPRTSYTNYYSKLGLYAFQYDFLQEFVRMEQTSLEIAESLEQLRALENGYKIKAVIGNYTREEVNSSLELERVRKIFANK